MTADVPTTRAISDEMANLSAIRARQADRHANRPTAELRADAMRDIDFLLAKVDSLAESLTAALPHLAQSSDEAVVNLVTHARQVAGSIRGGMARDMIEELVDHVLAQSSGRGADHALAEQIAQAIEAERRDPANSGFSVGWFSAMDRATRIARTFADEVTGR